MPKITPLQVLNIFVYTRAMGGAGSPQIGEAIMQKSTQAVEQISKYSAALGDIVALSISLDKGQAVVTINRGHSPRGEGYEFCTLEWSEHSKGLYWGHYDQTREAAAEDHRARFNQILGVK